MRLQTLRLRNFRNFPQLELTLPPGISVFFGDNGQGKTNLLEAVWLLATLKSLRGGRNADLVRAGEARADVEGRLVVRSLPRDYRVSVDPRGRLVQIDGKAARSLLDYFASIKAVAFMPGDLRLIDGPPTLRREFLDRAAFTLDPRYLEIARAYQQALRQKNAVLRDARRRDRMPDAATAALWNEGLVREGARIVARRVELLRELAPVFREVHASITAAAKGHAAIRYRSCVPGDAASAEDAARDALKKHVDAAWPEEVRRGYAIVGPHREDWDLRVGGEPLRTYGSQGQLRAAALSLRMALLLLTEKRAGATPLFLLDDVGSELDPSRNRLLMSRLAELDTQVLITTTSPEYLKLPAGTYTPFRVTGGAVEHAGQA